MKILTVMSGTMLSATGAWCLAYYRSAFSSVAFLLAVSMILSAIFLIASYLVSYKKRLPDTVLVEGLFSFLLGFVAINNKVSDASIALFFGAWVAMAGLSRFTQSLAVGRFDPKNWAKVLPLSLLSAILGLIMMHGLITTDNPLILVGTALITNGLSQLIYAMYMAKQEDLPQVQKARERALTKQKQAEEQRKVRDDLRQLTRSEQEKRIREIQAQAKAEAEEKKRLARLERERQKAAREALLDPTIQLTDEEMHLILAETGEPQPSASPQGGEPEALPASPALPPREPAPQPPAEPPRPVKADITDLLEKEVEKPAPLSIEPLKADDLFSDEGKAKPEEGEDKSREEDRFTGEFTWNWPL